MIHYGPIYTALVQSGWLSTASSLQRAIDEEARELMSFRKTRKTWKNIRNAEREAGGYYTEEIREILRACEDKAAPDPARLLTHRRYAIAWAVARFVRANSVTIEWEAPT